MASAERHREWAQRNEQFYSAIGGADGEWPDWAITALFYTALHEIAAFLRTHGQPAHSHKAIRGALRANPAWTDIAAIYEQLQTWSETSRYHCIILEPHKIKLAENLLAQLREKLAAA
jgi:hypothetical protein